MDDYIIRVKNVTVRFALASEKIDSMKDYVIKRIRGVISYDDFFALKHVSFDMKRGESIALIGLNGCGKSTLLKTIAGVLKPYEGKVEVFGSIGCLCCSTLLLDLFLASWMVCWGGSFLI